MVTSTPTVQIACKEHLDRLFARYPDDALHNRAARALRFLGADEEPVTGKPESWAAGIIYALSNLDRQACGVPGILNSEFSECFGVSMESIRRRAAMVVERLSI